MKVAVVLIVDDYEALNEAYALDYAFQSVADCGLSQPFHVLIAEGFSNIPRGVVGHWRERGVLIEDCAPTVRSLVRDHPWLAALPDNRTYRVTLLRHLILERHFGGEAVLSADVDIVWRSDPYRLFGDWEGGYFAVDRSGFLTFARAPEWFEAYRLGLESALTGGALTADFRQPKFGIDRVLHDQHLLNHLEAKGLIRNEWEAFRASPGLEDLALMSNPLYPKFGLIDPPERLTFERRADGDYVSGRRAPFWHMQTSFCLLCSFYFICQPLMGDDGSGGRLPFPRPKAGKDNLKAQLCHTLRDLILAGKVSDERLAALRPMMLRRGVYKGFFEGKFARRLFTENVWWRSGVWA
jgi:hypothetical protein